MWFIFPQLRGLGHSELANFFGIASREEAEAYLKHPILGERLRKCAALVNAIEGRTVSQIFGDPDDLKFRSSISLFSLLAADLVAADNRVFKDALEKYFGGQLDQRTVQRLR